MSVIERWKGKVISGHRAAPGVYCSRHAGGTVMCCDRCKVVWSPCCGERHACRSEPAPAVSNPLADWPGWE